MTTIQDIIIMVIKGVRGVVGNFVGELKDKSESSKISFTKLLEHVTESDVFESELKVVLETILPKSIAEKPKRKVSSKLKDPSAPKRPKSGYIFYCMDKRGEIKEAYPEMKATEITKELGKQWKALSDKKVAKYNALADEEKKEYKELMKEYERPSDEELEKVQPKKRVSKAKKEDNGMPKRAYSAYIFFSNEMRGQVKQDNEDMKPKEILSELGRLWKNEYSEEKKRAKWVALAKEAKEQYAKDLEAFNSEHPDLVKVPIKRKSKSVKETKKKNKKEQEEQEEEEEEVEEEQEEEVEEEQEEEKKPAKIVTRSKSKIVSKSPVEDSEDEAEPIVKKTKAKVVNSESDSDSNTHVTRSKSKKVAPPVDSDSESDSEPVSRNTRSATKIVKK